MFQQTFSHTSPIFDYDIYFPSKQKHLLYKLHIAIRMMKSADCRYKHVWNYKPVTMLYRHIHCHRHQDNNPDHLRQMQPTVLPHRDISYF